MQNLVEQILGEKSYTVVAGTFLTPGNFKPQVKDTVELDDATLAKLKKAGTAKSIQGMNVIELSREDLSLFPKLPNISSRRGSNESFTSLVIVL